MSFDAAFGELVKNAVSEVINPSFIKSVAEAIQQNTKQQESVIPYFNHNGAAAYLNTTRQSLTNYVKCGVVKCSRLNGSPRYKKSDLDAALIPIEIRPMQKHQS